MRLTDRYTYTDKLALLQGRTDRVNRVAERDSNAHCEDDPYHEEPIEERECFQRWKNFARIVGP